MNPKKFGAMLDGSRVRTQNADLETEIERLRQERDAAIGLLREHGQWHHHLKHIYTESSKPDFMQCKVAPCVETAAFLAQYPQEEVGSAASS